VNEALTGLCPVCSGESEGNFCRHCGTALGVRFCEGCGNELPAAASFCNLCGARWTEARDAREGAGNLVWWVAGAAMFTFVMVAGCSMINRDPLPAPSVAQAAATAPPIDLSQLSPRELADALFNHVMTASDQGQEQITAQFLPMALEAYESAAPLDLDGLFHLTLLQRTGGLFEESLATALDVLAAEPRHILGLDAAARAMAALGRTDEAVGYYESLVQNYDAELQRALPEYAGHGRYLAVANQEARDYLLNIRENGVDR
jgi:tetratricopeptide (TPR) repeat protein